MFSAAVLPVTLHEPVSKLSDMISFLAYFDTKRVLLLHVNTGAVTPASERRLERLRDEVVKELEDDRPTLDCRVRSGSPAYEIVTTAYEEGADFIYLPWKRKSWVQRTLVGSTTKDVIRLTSRPVFVYKQRRAKEEGEPFQILYPTNFKETDRFVVPYLGSPGLSADELLLLTVRERAPDPTAEGRERRKCEANLQRLAKEVAGNYKTVTPMEVLGHPRKEVVRLARRQKVDFLVLGKSDRQNALAAMMGSVAEEVAYGAPCSVFIVSRPYAQEGGGE